MLQIITKSKDEIFVKKNCEWIKVSHDPLNKEEIEELVTHFIINN
jgi:hypothetical protein